VLQGLRAATKWMSFLFLLMLCQSRSAFSQGNATSDSLLQGDLQDCVRYALSHQPAVRQTSINEAITEHAISSKLADWYPQLNFGFSFQHNPELPTSVIQGNPVKFGFLNTSTGQLSLSQTVFNRDVLLASSTASEVRKLSSEQTQSTKINVVVNASKAYYAVLVTQEQINLLSEDIARLQQNLADAYNQYKSGVVDKTDYQRATIALNNAKAEKLQSQELLKSRYAALKNQMGYPSKGDLEIKYDTTGMERQAMLDTTQSLVPRNRIEYQLLQTQKSLQEASLDYYKWGFLPSLTAYGNYNLAYQNNEFSQLYGNQYPNSNFGLQLSFPLFEGGKRIQEIADAKLQVEKIDEDLIALDNAVSAEYAAAMANYRSNLNNYRVLKENLVLATDVYQTIQLQYKAGTKTYLDVITAETDLRSAEANETDALYEVLSSKLDVQKALGTIQY
jgi:outer membrane protein